MNEIDLQAVLDALPDNAKLREHYSGRYMYGEICFGVVGARRDHFIFLAGLANALVMNEQDPEIAVEIAQTATVDQMALDWIMYFPGWTVARENGS
jgi:hypothetical protein